MLVMTLLIRRLGSKGKRLSIQDNFMLILRSQLKNIPSFALMIVNRDIAWGVLRCIVEFSFACLSSILAIFKSFKLNAELAIDFGGSICHYLFLSCLTCYLHDSTLKVFPVVGLVWVVQVIASVTVDFPNNLDHPFMGLRKRVWRRWWRSIVVNRWCRWRRQWWRRLVAVSWCRRVYRWRWRCIVVRWWWRRGGVHFRISKCWTYIFRNNHKCGQDHHQ